jgi:hypothetical protein
MFRAVFAENWYETNERETATAMTKAKSAMLLCSVTLNMRVYFALGLDKVS